MLIKALQLWIMLTVAASAIAANPTAVAVKPAVEVSGPNVVLSDIAGTDKSLGQVVICPSPLPGMTRVLTRDQIMVALKRAHVYGSVGLLCPDQITVTRASLTVSPEALLETARQFIMSSNNLPGIVSVEMAHQMAPQVIPAGKLEVRVKQGTAAVRRGQNNILVEIIVDGKSYRLVNVPALVRILASVPVAAKAVSRSEEISSANVSLQQRDITTLPTDIIIGQPEAGWTAVVPIPEGAVLRRSWVSNPPAIHSGDVVSVVVTSGSVTISDKGTAVQDGRPGELIKIRMLGDAREIRGTVGGPGVVQLTTGRN